ncbi:acid phosphatase [Aerophototrophica crusticola]|uniref:Acid phosphatase n=1 Tax=Aerophototrophica crusticola TaxID=1709002 RepID=A0A858R734_9PROT|nr:acid phosphatase [Rhodospirillaceae bacterium B3]
MRLRLSLLALALLLPACSALTPPRAAPVPDAPPVPAPAPVAAAPVVKGANDPRLLATLYVQQAEEARRAAEQAFALAALRLPDALRKTGSAAPLEQPDGGKGKPPAVVFDVDETVLDNSPYQARAILAGERFTAPTWDQWVSEKKAAAIPGAPGFVAALRKAGVRPVFVTNRACAPRPDRPEEDCPQKADTIANLRATGFGEVPPEDLLLYKEQGWTADKSKRRAAVAAKYRIVMLVGDQLGDFVDVPRTADRTARRTLADAGQFSTRWVMVPNPMYGGWADSLPDPVAALRVD